MMTEDPGMSKIRDPGHQGASRRVRSLRSPAQNQKAAMPNSPTDAEWGVKDLVRAYNHFFRPVWNR